MKRKGILFVISAPSGAGKTTLCRELMNTFPDLKFSISYTTRDKRKGEVDGKDYHFTPEESFRKMISEGAFAEWAEVHGKLYGTKTEDIKKATREGNDIILDIDWQGARQIREKMGEGVYIFILPPGIEELEKRLRERGKDSEEIIRKRVRNAGEEMSHSSWYDYNITNDDLPLAANALKSIIVAERCRTSLYSRP
ncbi:MAG: guanylate kinase [Deltaproteobacteria bacterium]|nr:guanylate kinase [Deltaproteobacteria bacterium]